jgi:hypothetical protein
VVQKFCCHKWRVGRKFQSVPEAGCRGFSASRWWATIAWDAGSRAKLAGTSQKVNACSRHFGRFCSNTGDIGKSGRFAAAYGLLHSTAVFGIALRVANEQSLASRMRV